MSKKGMLLIIFFVSAVGLPVWSGRQPPEPVYQGKALSEWLKDLEHWNGNPDDPPFVAFRHMPTNAVPALLNVIQSGGSPIEKMILTINRKQSLINLPFGTPWHETLAASWALYEMGTNANSALPALTILLFHTNALIDSTTALAGIGSEAVPVLITALTNQDYRIRHSAAAGLGWERSDFSIVVPALISRVKDGNGVVRNEAVISLGLLHAEPELTVPALIKVFSSSNNDALLRRLVLISLSEFESKAKACVPMLVDALKDNNEGVRESARSALMQIDPDAASKAGVR
jgi:hypothetical protein